MLLIRSLLCAALLLVPVLGELSAAEQTGRFQLTFTGRSPYSAWTEMAPRYGWPHPKGPCPAMHAYDITKEPYDVSVPTSYDGTAAYGLIAYVNSGGGGGAGSYQKVLDQHRLIWIGGTKVGNERDVPSRIGLTIDAVHQMQQRYRIDPDRIYVCGTSGGGRTASGMGVAYADVFTGGGIYLIGCNSPIWPQLKPTAELIRALAPERRYAFMTGSEDFNKEDTQGVFAAYQAENLPHVKYFEQAGLGHGNPSDEQFEQAIIFVDGPLVARAQAAYDRGEALMAVKAKRVEAYKAFSQAAASTINPEVAAKAKPKVEALRTAIDADLAKELATLQTATPSAVKLRAFAAQWAEFPSGISAKERADELAATELDALLAKDPNLTLKPLRTFVSTWKGYPTGERALAALDAVAQPAWAPVSALPAGDKRLRALAKYAAEWAPTPSAAAADKTFTEELRAALAAIVAEAKPMLRGQKLQAFAAAWKGTDAGKEAQDLAAALAAELKADQKK